MARWLQLETAMRTWKCTICGAVVGGDEPPAHCSECGARHLMFEPSLEPPHGIPHNPLQPRDEREQNEIDLGPGGCLDLPAPARRRALRPILGRSLDGQAASIAGKERRAHDGGMRIVAIYVVLLGLGCGNKSNPASPDLSVTPDL